MEQIEYKLSEYNIVVTKTPTSILGFYDWIHTDSVFDTIRPEASLVISTDDQMIAQMVSASVDTLELACTMHMINVIGALGLIVAYAQNKNCYVEIIQK